MDGASFTRDGSGVVESRESHQVLFLRWADQQDETRKMGAFLTAQNSFVKASCTDNCSVSWQPDMNWTVRDADNRPLSKTMDAVIVGLVAGPGADMDLIEQAAVTHAVREYLVAPSKHD